MTSVFFRKLLFHRCNLCKNYSELQSRMVSVENYALEKKKPHIPVMVREVVDYLNLQEGSTFLDMTFGAGSHSEALLGKVPKLQVYALDRDPTVVEHVKELQEKYPGQITFLEGKFSDLPDLLKNHNVKPDTFDGILFDLGCSSMQLDNGERGFSISKNGPLDMRMDKSPTSKLTAADVVAYAEEKDLFNIIKIYGGEKRAYKITQAILQARAKFKPLTTTSELREVIETALGNEVRSDALGRITSVATKTFQALRIFINNEINELYYGLLLAHKYLKPGGRAVVLSFHSGEDFVVKREFQNRSVDNCVQPLSLIYFNSNKFFDQEEIVEFQPKNWKVLTKKVVFPTTEELIMNPRSRSAKLRAAIKLNSQWEFDDFVS